MTRSRSRTSPIATHGYDVLLHRRRGHAQLRDGWRSRPQLPPARQPRPVPDEIEACEPYLFRQIELIEPRVIATLGNFATKLLSGKQLGITRVHGQEQDVTLGGRRVLLYPLYHPAAALYTPSMLTVLEEDFARLPGLLDADPPSPPSLRRSPSSPCGAGRAGGTTRPLLIINTSSAAETEEDGARLAAPPRRGRRPRRRRAGLGEDDVRARRLPGARRRTAGHEPDVHHRQPVRGACPRLPSRPLPARRVR